jgi:hypothetical protein
MKTAPTHKPFLHIYGGASCWVARYPTDSETYRVMGTRDIETAYTLRTPLGEVVERIAALNPEYEVTASRDLSVGE